MLTVRARTRRFTVPSRPSTPDHVRRSAVRRCAHFAPRIAAILSTTPFGMRFHADPSARRACG